MRARVSRFLSRAIDPTDASDDLALDTRAGHLVCGLFSGVYGFAEAAAV